jgi:hypothetical protein
MNPERHLKLYNTKARQTIKVYGKKAFAAPACFLVFFPTINQAPKK